VPKHEIPPYGNIAQERIPEKSIEKPIHSASMKKINSMPKCPPP